MKLNGECKARCKRYDKKETGRKRKDALTADLHFEIVSTPAQAKKLYGKDFAEMCFSDTLSDGDAVIHRVAMKTPSPDFKPEKHAIDIEGTEVVAKPVLGHVYPVKDAVKVKVTMRVPVYVGGNGAGSTLEAMAGKDVTLGFSETQRPLPFEENAGGNDDEDEDGGDDEKVATPV